MKAMFVVFGDRMLIDALSLQTPAAVFLCIDSIEGAESGDRIRRFRKRLGITQSKLAERVGVSIHKISKAENDPQSVTIQVLNWICEALCDELALSLGIVDGDNADGASTGNVVDEQAGVARRLLGWSLKTPQGLKALVDFCQELL